MTLISKLFGFDFRHDLGDAFPKRYCHACGKEMMHLVVDRGHDAKTGELIAYTRVWVCPSSICEYGHAHMHQHSKRFVK
jgi:hypothetical protein